MKDKVELLDSLIQQALGKLYEKDYHLILNRAYNDFYNDLKHHVGERSIVFRFAHYLQNLMDETGAFNDFVLDCEYNRDGAEGKKLPSFPNGTYPDIIIHQRGTNDCNLAVIEVKTYWNKDTTIDESKLREFTDAKGKYKFQRGYSFVISKKLKDIKAVCYRCESSGDHNAF